MNNLISMGIGVIVITHDGSIADLFDEVYEFRGKSFVLAERKKVAVTF